MHLQLICIPLLLWGILAGFNCTQPVDVVPGSHPVVFKIEATDPVLKEEMLGIDRLTIDISSPAEDSVIVLDFSYSSQKGNSSRIPFSVDIAMRAKWLNHSGAVLYEGLFNFDSLPRDTVTISLTGDILTPRVPSDVVASVNYRNHCILEWKDNSHFETHYEIERAILPDSTYQPAAKTTEGSFTDSTIGASMKYVYRLYAVNKAGYSEKIYSGHILSREKAEDPPQITILSHMNPDTVSKSLVTLVGTVEPHAEIQGFHIDDKAVALDGSIWRSPNLQLKNGTNDIVLRASGAGTETSVKLSLFYLPGHIDTSRHAPEFKVHPANLEMITKPGIEYRKVLSAYDPDQTTGLRFLVAHDAITSDDTNIIWIPGIDDIGTHRFSAIVFDSTGLFDSIGWMVQVMDPNANIPPVFDQIAASIDTIFLGGSYLRTIRATDPDGRRPPVYNLDLGATSGIIDSVTGIIMWTPQPADLGTWLAKARACDESGACSQVLWIVTVIDTMPVRVDAGKDTTVSIGDTVFLRGRAVKENGSITLQEWDIGATGTFVPVKKGDTLIIAPPTPGEIVSIFRAKDNAGFIRQDTIKINVIRGEPSIQAGKDIMLRQNDTLRLVGKASDKYGRIVRYEWKIGNGDWITTESPAYTSKVSLPGGRYTCTFRVTDDDSNKVTRELLLLITRMPMRVVGKPNTIFKMGSDDFEMDERPVHEVNITPFYADSTEVTQDEYQFTMGANPSVFRESSRPVEGVSWFDAALYCNERSKRDGFDTVYSYTTVLGEWGNRCTGLKNLAINLNANGYRLPTEAEWESMCSRDSLAQTYYWGVDELQALSYAWHSANLVSQSPQTVARLRPNKNGLYDLAGNVWEWCNDWYSDDYYTTCNQLGVVPDPSGPAHGIARVIRGGSWRDPVIDLRITNRDYGTPSWTSSFVGFRCVLPARE